MLHSLLFAVLVLAPQQDSQEFHGRVVDADGGAVVGATVLDTWVFHDPTDHADGNPGPHPSNTLGIKLVTDSEGGFSGSLSGFQTPRPLLILGPDGNRGAIVPAIEAGALEDITLEDLVVIRGRIVCVSAGVQPKEVHASIRPAGCRWNPIYAQGLTGKFHVRLPPGKYEICYSTDLLPGRQTPTGTECVVESDSSEVDLGVIEVEAPMLAEVHMVILDGTGQPIEDASAAHFWLSDQELSGVSNGQMVPFGGGRSDSAGLLTIRHEIYDAEANTCYLVFDSEQKRGSVVVVESDDRDQLTSVTLQPTIRVHGNITFEGMTETPEWSNVYAYLTPGDFRVARSAGTSGQFKFRLPPGEFRLRAYGTNAESLDVPLVLKADQADLDLGTIQLKPTAAYFLQGKLAPPLEITDSRGVPQDMTLRDYRGRYVLIEFWGYW